MTHCLACRKQNELEVSGSASWNLSLPYAMFSTCVGTWLMPNTTYCFNSCFEETHLGVEELAEISVLLSISLLVDCNLIILVSSTEDVHFIGSIAH